MKRYRLDNVNKTFVLWYSIDTFVNSKRGYRDLLEDNVLSKKHFSREARTSRSERFGLSGKNGIRLWIRVFGLYSDTRRFGVEKTLAINLHVHSKSAYQLVWEEGPQHDQNYC